MAFARSNSLMNHLKNVVDVTNENENTVGFVLEKAVNDAANYCNLKLEDIPTELDLTIVSIAATFIETHGLINKNDNDNDVQSISEGDTSVTYRSHAQTYAQILAANTITDDYIMQLNRFRKMRF